MQNFFQLDFRTGHVIFGKDLRKLTNTFLIGSGRTTNIEMITYHHNIAAFQRAGSLDVFDLIVCKELFNGADDLFLFAVSGCCTGIGDDRALSGNKGRILNKAGIRISFVRFQHRNIDAALFQSGNIIVMLF